MTDRVPIPPERPLPADRKQARMTHLVDEASRVPKSRLTKWLRRLPKLSRPRAIALVAAGAAAALVIVALSPSGDDQSTGNPFLDRALAALNRSSVLWHIKSITIDHNTVEHPKWAEINRSELWTYGKDRLHSIDSTRGVPAGRTDAVSSDQEVSKDGDRVTWYLKEDGDEAVTTVTAKGKPLAGGGAISLGNGSGPVDPVATVKKWLVANEVIRQGPISYRGHAAYKVVLDFPKKQGGPGEQTFVFDRRTYYPLEIRLSTFPSSPLNIPGASDALIIRFTKFEALPLNSKTKSLLKQRPHPGAKVCTPSKRPMSTTNSAELTLCGFLALTIQSR